MQRPLFSENKLANTCSYTIPQQNHAQKEPLELLVCSDTPSPFHHSDRFDMIAENNLRL